MHLGPEEKAVIMISGRDPLEEIGGGHCSYVRAHARAARAAGYAPHLWCVSRNPGDVECDYGTVHRVRDRGLPHRQTMAPVHARTLAGAIASHASTARAVVMHGFGVWSYAGVFVKRALERQQRRMPFLMSMYTVYEEEARAQRASLERYPTLLHRIRAGVEWRWIRHGVARCERRAIDAADAVAVNYESVSALALRHYPGARGKIRKAGYGPESAFLPSESAPELPPEHAAWMTGGGPVYLTVALQQPKKGVDVLLRAMAILRGEGASGRLCIVGAGSMAEEHRRLAQSLGLKDHVLLPGFVPDVRPWLRACDIYVQPSIREESGSLALLEALQQGKPAICSGVDGILEDVRDGRDALLTAPGDPRALAAAMLRLQRRPEHSAALAAGARSTFAARFSSSVFTEGLHALYQSL
jgi:glycosyltransferase involved in cell wall biosynthesis